MLANVHLASEVRKQVPVLLDKLVDAPSFVTGRQKERNINNQYMFLDSPPIRLIKGLCRLFDETVQHIFCAEVSLKLFQINRDNLFN